MSPETPLPLTASMCPCCALACTFLLLSFPVRALWSWIPSGPLAPDSLQSLMPGTCRGWLLPATDTRKAAQRVCLSFLILRLMPHHRRVPQSFPASCTGKEATKGCRCWALFKGLPDLSSSEHRSNPGGLNPCYTPESPPQLWNTQIFRPLQTQHVRIFGD